MFAEVRLRDGSGYSNITILRNVQGLTFDDKYNDIGAINLALSKTDVDAYGIGDGSVIEIAPDGNLYENMWYYLDGINKTTVTDSGLVVTFTGKSLIGWLDDGIVYPSTWFSPVTNPEKFGVPTTQGSVTVWTPLAPTGVGDSVVQGHSFQNATPGNIVRTLIARCQERGTLSDLLVDFSGTLTSDSVAWAGTLTNTYNTGTKLRAVLDDLVSRRLIDYRMNGKTLQLYNFGAISTTYTADQITFRAGKHITEQTTNIDASEATDVVLVQGEQSVLKELSDPTLTSANGRRRESYLAVGGITDGPSLQTIGIAQLTISGHIQVEDTLGVSDNDIKPWVNYRCGDWVWVDSDGTLRKIQVQQIAASQQDNGTLQIGLTLGDLIKDQDQRLQQLIDNMTGGVDSRGGLPDQNTYTGPSDPSAVVAAPSAYRDGNGVDAALVVITWASPTTRIDGTTLTDLDRFEVRYKLGASTTWSTVASIPASATPLAAYISNLPCGVAFTSQIRAVNNRNIASNWVDQSNTISALPKVTTAPNAPSVPTLTPIIKGLKVSWDGLTSTATNYGAEWARTEVHLSTIAGFTPSPSTLVGSFSTLGGSITITGLSEANTYYARLLTYDKSGNVSVAGGVSAGGTPIQITSAEIAPNSITATMIQDGVITGAKIANGTINTNNLTVSSFGDSVAPNGSFEDATNQPGVDTTGAAGWKYISWPGGATVGSATLSTSGADSAAGSNAVLLSVPNGVNGGVIALTTPIPTSNPDVWFVSFKVKANQNLNSRLNVIASVGSTSTEANSVAHTANGANIAAALAEDMNGMTSGTTNLNLTTSYQTWEVGFTVPSNTAVGGNPYKYVNIFLGVPLGLPLPSDLVVYFDTVEIRPVGGTASITSVAASKIVAGTLGADIIVGARIATADVAQRVELNPDGIQAFDSLNNQTVSISARDGSVSLIGSLNAGMISTASIGGSQIVGCTIGTSSILIDTTGGALLVYQATGQSSDIITTSTTTWTAPAGITRVKVECWGGGGGGSGGAAVGTFGGTGGSGGEYAREDFVAVTPTTVYSIRAGAGGAASAAGVNHAGDGLSSFFVGDAVTVTANGGVGAWGALRANGGSGSTNSVHFSGGAGANLNSFSAGTGGGSSAGVSQSGVPGASPTSNTVGGVGGRAPTGAGNGGTGGVNNGFGIGGTIPGGGGGGGGGASGGRSGGAGARGKVVVTYGGTMQLIGSISSAAGVDAFGTAYPPGASFYGTIITDWNSATLPGFYSGAGGAINSPNTSAAYAGYVWARSADSTQSIVQAVWRLNTADSPEGWIRQYSLTNGWRGWRPLYLDTKLTGQVTAHGTSGQTLGFSISTGTIKRAAALAYLRITTTITAGSITAGASGNISNQVIGTITDSTLWADDSYPLRTLGTGPDYACFTDTTGQVYLTSLPPGVTVSSSSNSTFTIGGWYFVV